MSWNIFKKISTRRNDNMSYKGVSFIKSKNKYIAQLWVPTKGKRKSVSGYNIYIGTYETRNEAAIGRTTFINNLY